MSTTNEPTLRRVQCLDASGLHRMAYWQWERAGGAADRVLVCAHGVTRQGRDFDVLARAMQDGFRVVCPDVVGRGESDRAKTYAERDVDLVPRAITALEAMKPYAFMRCRPPASRHWTRCSSGPFVALTSSAPCR